MYVFWLRTYDPLFNCAGLVVQFMPDVYTATEGETVVFRAVLNIAADRNVFVNFQTRDGSAQSGTIYVQTL